MKNISEKSLQIAAAYANEVAAAQQMDSQKDAKAVWPELPLPPSLQDHCRMITEFLQDEGNPPLTIDTLLPEKLLQSYTERIIEDSHLKAHFPEGFDLLLTIIPFSSNGYPMDKEEIADGAYLKFLLLEPLPEPERSIVIRGFSLFPNRIDRLIPRELREITFQIPKYDTEGIYEITFEDRNRITAKFTESFTRLKETLRPYFPQP